MQLYNYVLLSCHIVVALIRGADKVGKKNLQNLKKEQWKREVDIV